MKEAATAYTAALALKERLAADFPTRPEFRQDLARTHGNLGVLLRDSGRLSEAEAAFAHVLALHKKLVADFPEPARVPPRGWPRATATWVSCSATRADRGKRRRSMPPALGLKKRLAADFPNRPESVSSWPGASWDLGILLRDTGRLKEAEGGCTIALALWKQLADDFPTRLKLPPGPGCNSLRTGHPAPPTGRSGEADEGL